MSDTAAEKPGIKSKAMEMMMRTAISAMGIDADSLLVNIRSFQEYVTNAIQHHDRRLVALENGNRELGEKLDRVLSILEKVGAEYATDFESGERAADAGLDKTGAAGFDASGTGRDESVIGDRREHDHVNAHYRALGANTTLVNGANHE